MVRYEDLVTNPEGTLKRVSRRCRLRWDVHAAERVLGAARRRLVDVEDRWSQLPPSIRGYSLQVIRDLQQSLGYPDA